MYKRTISVGEEVMPKYLLLITTLTISCTAKNESMSSWVLESKNLNGRDSCRYIEIPKIQLKGIYCLRKVKGGK